jgi:pimeloyl-ACP methyl ester carboxylesterase
VKPYVLYIAGKDEILPLKEYEVLRKHSAITVVTIPGADHNFNGDSRREVISAIGASLRRGQS